MSSVTIRNDPASPDGSYLNSTNIANSLALTNVRVDSTNNIDIAENINLANSPAFGPTYGTLALNTVTINLVHSVLFGAGNLNLNAQTVNLNAKVTGTNGLVLAGSRITGTATQ